MKNNKLLGVVLWVIGLLLTHLIIFIIPDKYTAAIWITYGFTLFAFISQLILWLWIWRKELTASEQFLYMPVLTISVAYLLLQFVAGLFFVFVSVSAKIAFLINALIVILIATAVVVSLIAKNAIVRVDRRQKDHHKEL